MSAADLRKAQRTYLDRLARTTAAQEARDELVRASVASGMTQAAVAAACSEAARGDEPRLTPGRVNQITKGTR